MLRHAFVLLKQGTGSRIGDEGSIHPAVTSCQAIGFVDIVDGDGLRAVGRTYPVSVRQVDTDWRSGIRVTGKHSYRDDCSRYTAGILLLEAGIDGSMRFEPRCLTADLRRALARLLITDMHERFPHPLHPEGVSIDFGEAIDEVHDRLRIADPVDRIAVVLFQIALLVVFDERKNGLALGFALSISHSGLEVGDDLAQGLAVESVLLVDLFVELAVFGLC